MVFVLWFVCLCLSHHHMLFILVISYRLASIKIGYVTWIRVIELTNRINLYIHFSLFVPEPHPIGCIEFISSWFLIFLHWKRRWFAHLLLLFYCFLMLHFAMALPLCCWCFCLCVYVCWCCLGLRRSFFTSLYLFLYTYFLFISKLMFRGVANVFSFIF